MQRALLLALCAATASAYAPALRAARPRRLALRAAAVDAGGAVAAAKTRLLAEVEGADQGRDLKRRGTVQSHIEALEAMNPTAAPLASPLLSGRWRLVYTTSDSILGTKRLRPFRPRPRILQHINAESLRAYNEEWVLGGLLRNSVRATLAPAPADATRTVDVQFTRFGLGWLKIPAPAKARGTLTTTFLDGDLRISRGDRGSIFVLVRDGKSRV